MRNPDKQMNENYQAKVNKSHIRVNLNIAHLEWTLKLDTNFRKRNVCSHKGIASYILNIRCGDSH